MSAIARDIGRPVIILGGIGYLGILAVGLIWLHLPPHVVLALTVGGAAFLVFTIRPFVGVQAFIALLNVENVVSTSGGMTGMKLLGAIILAGWLSSVMARRGEGLRRSAFLLALVLFILWGGLSMTGALDTRTAASRLLTFAELGIATLMFASVVDTAERLRGIYLAIVAWTCLGAVTAIAQYLLGQTPVAVGLVGNRNLLALYINIAIVCCYLLYQSERSVLTRGLLLATLPVLFTGLALTFSRAGLVVLLVALLSVWYRVVREKGIMILTTSLAILCTLTLLLPEAFWRRAGSILPAVQRQEDTFGMRVRLWKVGLRMVEDKPLVGVGPGNFRPAFPRYARGEMLTKRLVAHSSYIGVAAETGAVGLALFLALHGLALAQAGRATRAGRRARLRGLYHYGLAAQVGLLVIMLAGLTSSGENLKYLWVFFGLSLALGRIASRERLEMKAPGDSPRVEARPGGRGAWVAAR
ncbi:MAG: O-antigen ligase family protein [Acidobacteriota bacterium]